MRSVPELGGAGASYFLLVERRLAAGERLVGRRAARGARATRRVSGDAPVLLRLRRRACRCRRKRGLRSTRGHARRLFSGGASSGSGRRVEVQVAAEVHEQQPVVAAVAEEAQDERLGRQHGAVHAARPLGAEDGVFAAQPQQVAVQGVDGGVALPLRKVELAALERPGVVRGRRGRRVPRTPRALGNCLRNSARPLRTSSGQLRRVVGEVEERARTRRTPGPGTASACPAPAASGPSWRGSGRGWSAGAAAGRGRSWPPDRGFRGRSRNAAGGRSSAGVPRRFFCQR